MNKLEITKGDWEVFDEFRKPKVINESGQAIFGHNQGCFDEEEIKGELMHSYYSHNKMIANAQLIADAGTTYNKCGLTPSELLDYYKETLNLLSSISDRETPVFDDEAKIEYENAKMECSMVVYKHRNKQT